ncbi:MAG: L-lysine 6-transaminase [Nitriliruptorales bacterium]
MVEARDVHELIGRHLVADGFEFVLDIGESRGSWLVDARDGTRYLDMFGFFASSPLGFNHPGFDAPDFLDELVRVARTKPSNGDVYTVELASFVETFERVVGDPALPRLFLIDGGALAVENALKAAFDWKQQRNEAAGRSGELGTQVLHLTRAFHGRTGYTMSLTNTEPVKIARFPKFDWPRISTPGMRFPVDDHLDEIAAAEDRAIEEAEAAFRQRAHDIACFIAEPILAEGGDIHLRAGFLQRMQALCHEHEALFVVDEVQTGGGAAGTPWCYQQLGIEPDIVAFGKKLQTCGIMAGRRLEEVETHVFRVPSRIDSTWGGNLTDMVRARRMLEIVEEEGLIARAATVGEHLLTLLGDVESAHPERASNVRGRGLLAAFDLPSREERDEVIRRLRQEERVVLLPCGERSIRFRPNLAVEEDELAQACEAITGVLKRMEN